MSNRLSEAISDAYKSTKGAPISFHLMLEKYPDGVLKDIFGVSGKEFLDLKAAISGLQKGELVIKDNTADILGIGKKWKKIKVSHLI